MIKCEMCGNGFEAGNRPDGTPNGVGFTLEVKDDGTAVLDLAGDKTNLKYDSKFFSDSESKSKYTFKDGVLTISSEDASMVFKKN